MMIGCATPLYLHASAVPSPLCLRLSHDRHFYNAFTLPNPMSLNRPGLLPRRFGTLSSTCRPVNGVAYPSGHPRTISTECRTMLFCFTPIADSCNLMAVALTLALAFHQRCTLRRTYRAMLEGPNPGAREAAAYPSS
ncbi:hypothetical protein VTO73DRAFT_15019 [Trametes versicolor]